MGAWLPGRETDDVGPYTRGVHTELELSASYGTQGTTGPTYLSVGCARFTTPLATTANSDEEGMQRGPGGVSAHAIVRVCAESSHALVQPQAHRQTFRQRSEKAGDEKTRGGASDGW